MLQATAIRQHPRDYTWPVLLDERDSLGWVMKALREAGNSVMSELAGLEEAVLRERPNEDEMSLKEIACHLRDAEELAVLQITSLIEEPDRPLPTWDIDVFVLERDYRSANVARTLGEYRGLRRETTHLLFSLRRSEWERSARHPYRGEVSLETIARELAQHDLEHLWKARQIKFDLGAKTQVSDEWDTDDW